MRGKYVRQVQQRDLEFNLINTFDSVEDAVKATGITKGQIYNCLNGRQYQTHGYVFLWQEDYDRFVAEKEKETKEKEKTLIPDVELMRLTLLTMEGPQDVYIPVYRNLPKVEYR